MEQNNPMIQVNHLCKSFGRLEVLKDISTTFQRGSVVAIIGPSGGGKSTFLRCLNLLEKPTGGEIIFDGVDICDKKTDINLHRQKIGMVFQQFNLFNNMNVLRNLTAAPVKIKGMAPAEAEEKALKLLNRVGLGDKLTAYPAQLSGGQKQRVAIARALAPSPKVLLCDEATSALDPTTTRSILSLLKEINRTLGITIVVITHEMSVIEEICDRVAIIDHSRIAEAGDVSDIFMNPKTDIARKLLYASGRLGEEVLGERCLRIIFDGTQTSSPVICDMVLECGAPVNILFADTKTIEGKMHGYTLIQLPENRELGDKMKKYLDLHGVQYLEEAYHV